MFFLCPISCYYNITILPKSWTKKWTEWLIEIMIQTCASTYSINRRWQALNRLKTNFSRRKSFYPRLPKQWTTATTHKSMIFNTSQAYFVWVLIIPLGSTFPFCFLLSWCQHLKACCTIKDSAPYYTSSVSNVLIAWTV